MNSKIALACYGAMLSTTKYPEPKKIVVEKETEPSIIPTKYTPDFAHQKKPNKGFKIGSYNSKHKNKK